MVEELECDPHVTPRRFWGLQDGAERLDKMLFRLELRPNCRRPYHPVDTSRTESPYPILWSPLHPELEELAREYSAVLGGTQTQLVANDRTTKKDPAERGCR